MEPISSSVSARASAAQAPLPAQQKRDQEAIDAPQPRADSLNTASPVQELQLQRRQVVEDLGKSQNVRAQLDEADTQLKAGKALAEQATNENTAAAERQTLQASFDRVSSNLNAIADRTEKSGGSIDPRSLRVSSGVTSRDDARATGQALDGALQQVASSQAAAVRQEQDLAATFPRKLRADDSQPDIQSRQQANQVAQQLKQQLQQQPGNALETQANVSQQTALTLFQ